MTAPQRNKILEKCQCKPDILLDTPEIIFSRKILKKFKQKKVSLDNLIDLQLVIPVLYPWDKGYNESRGNCYPMAIVIPELMKDIVIAVEWCYNRDIPISPDGIIINQSKRTEISIDDTIVIVEPGVLQGCLQVELAKYDLAFVGTIYPHLSVLDLVLNNGIGLLTRKYGLITDNLISIEIVLYNGKIIRVNSKQNTDLFWALCGNANFNFGVITELAFKVHPIPEINIFNIKFNNNKIVDIWKQWAPFVDNNLSSKLTNFNSVNGQYIGSKENLKLLLQPILQFQPEEYILETVSYIDAVRYFAKFNNHEIYALGGIFNKISKTKTSFPYRDLLFYVEGERICKDNPNIKRLKEIKAKYNSF
jgi:hypothetical protein